VRRSTFLIDEFGNISKIFAKVHISSHSRDVLEAAKQLLPGAGKPVEK
jgi:peroxiredoxin